MESETQLLSHHRRPISIVNVVEPAYFRFSLASGESNKETDLCTFASFLFSSSSSGNKYSGGSSGSNQWSLESHKTYMVSLDIYDQDNHRIFPSDNQRITLSFSDSDFVDVIESSVNGTVHLIRALKTGPLSLKASLSKLIDEVSH